MHNKDVPMSMFKHHSPKSLLTKVGPGLYKTSKQICFCGSEVEAMVGTTWKQTKMNSRMVLWECLVGHVIAREFRLCRERKGRCKAQQKLRRASISKL